MIDEYGAVDEIRTGRGTELNLPDCHFVYQKPCMI
jgi:hypothetical protein